MDKQTVANPGRPAKQPTAELVLPNTGDFGADALEELASDLRVLYEALDADETADHIRSSPDFLTTHTYRLHRRALALAELAAKRARPEPVPAERPPANPVAAAGADAIAAIVDEDVSGVSGDDLPAVLARTRELGEAIAVQLDVLEVALSGPTAPPSAESLAHVVGLIGNQVWRLTWRLDEAMAKES